MGEDKREHPRIPIELRVDYPKLNAFFADYTRNISKGGTFIRTKRPLPIGTRFIFRLSVPNVEAPFVLDGEVTWVRGEGDDPGMGIRFLYEDDSVRQRLEEAVERMMAESLGPALSTQLLRGHGSGPT